MFAAVEYRNPLFAHSRFLTLAAKRPKGDLNRWLQITKQCTFCAPT